MHHSQAGTVSLLGTPEASLGVKVTFLERFLGTDSKDQEKLKTTSIPFKMKLVTNNATPKGIHHTANKT